MDGSMFIGTWWSLVPPLLAIVLALVTKEVYSSLFIGVAMGLFAIQHTQTGIASTLMALVPIFIIAPSAIMFKEKITARQVAGAVISIFGASLFFM